MNQAALSGFLIGVKNKMAKLKQLNHCKWIHEQSGIIVTKAPNGFKVKFPQSNNAGASIVISTLKEVKQYIDGIIQPCGYNPDYPTTIQQHLWNYEHDLRSNDPEVVENAKHNIAVLNSFLENGYELSDELILF
ncbi:hypothetical protein H3V11_10770 [Snodgrassella sp. W8158]|uniref:hypothetical protein n=1 Tax=Snodgrassella sp. W8158 TaxID=2751018 RepID=UPI0018DB79C7|nr:hypothetical protein [Snodgrassella sp. W8158]MBI0182416.1 hypothetical protein [Snodgrassella sp. W8158]